MRTREKGACRFSYLPVRGNACRSCDGEAKKIVFATCFSCSCTGCMQR